MIATVAATSGRSVESIETPVGGFWFGSAQDGSPLAGWVTLDGPPEQVSPPRLEWNLADRLMRHFCGRFDDFRDLPLPTGPAFFRSCWRALRTSQPGERWSYRELAIRAGRPAAVRAAGAAMRRNPAPILIPCHRVVASDDSLGGYAGRWGPSGPGAVFKRFLLDLEGSLVGGTPADRGEPRLAIHR